MKSIRLMPDYQCFPLWNMMPSGNGGSRKILWMGLFLSGHRIFGDGSFEFNACRECPVYFQPEGWGCACFGNCASCGRVSGRVCANLSIVWEIKSWRVPLRFDKGSLQYAPVHHHRWPWRPCATRMLERRSYTIASKQPASTQCRLCW